MVLTQAVTIKFILTLFLSLYFICYYFIISPRRSQAKQSPLKNYVPQFFVNDISYLCKDSHHSCRAKALYIPSISKIPCVFCPYSCGLCMICPNNIHLWNKCCTSQDIMINSVKSFHDTPTSKKYLARVYEWIDGSNRYAYPYLGIAISKHHVITGRNWGTYDDPKDYTIYLNYNYNATSLKLTPDQFILNLRYNTQKNVLCIVAVKETIPKEYIIPLTTVSNPDGRMGHYMGMGHKFTESTLKEEIYSLMEGESEIIAKKVTTEYQNRQYLMVLRTCDIDDGSPLLILEGGRFVLQGIYVFGGGINKKCYGHFVNIGAELQWINEVINNKTAFISS